MNIQHIEAISVLQQQHRLNIAQIGERAAAALAELQADAAARGMEISGPPIFQAQQMPQDAQCEFSLAFCLPVSGKTAQQLPALRCASRIYQGALDGLFSEGYEPLLAAITAAGLRPSGESREVYHCWHGPQSADNRIEIQIGLLG
ncbi:AraC family transcriptional regulator [Pseudomonas sp. NCCP-436]|uniref:AraC family transcriptional regulator n=1 Tax=Pseudomonas sp. NCCP-436 TaxID=2842481 RepID=UPI001C80AADF|nr:AraC family transcriptional regulator [Pseudomonas sp. NCCP-436]GIZ11063.1 hypothetical protein NCCP436_04790 [Pseudomonas sp. NCCP-436]